MSLENHRNKSYKRHKTAYLLLFLLTALPPVSSPAALVMGFSFCFLFGNPLPKLTARASNFLLKLSVVGLGFGVNFIEVVDIGKDSLLLTLVSIAATIGLGEVIGQLMRLPRNTRCLVSFGTAICGGSAIAAIAPVIKAKDDEIAVSLATIFTLNAFALIIFPPMGGLFALNDYQFGLWSALAIHDTSSVVGATAAFGTVALTVSTTTKLVRALWIAPYSMVASFFWKTEEGAKVPIFILGFMAAALINSWMPAFDPIWDGLYSISRRLLVMTLFLIGAGLTRQVLKQVGIRPLILGIILWVIVASVTLWLIIRGYI
ncbi:MAG: putative sulfate exporter family transporter [Deltaproteobacteria bacterium]|jgi:uncharacterized integral membrane protein (TIGR00698 family)|nr:putative sulfate exporter family transporter [Deltaproteobacteria bacterium]